MLESLDLSHRLSKEAYQQQVEGLMLDLANLQRQCWQASIPVIVVLEGWAASGKGDYVRSLVEYMDPRGFIVHPVWPPTEQEQQFPFLRRFWLRLPPHGKVGIFYHSWYTRVLEDRLFTRIDPAQVPQTIQQINAFERQLHDDGAVIIKLWMHVSKKKLNKRLKKAAQDELRAWRIRPEDWQQAKHYDEYRQLAEEMLIYSSTGAAPWTLIEADCRRWASIKSLTTLTAALRSRLEQAQLQQITSEPSLPAQTQLAPMEPDWLAKVDLSQQLSEDDYHRRLGEAQVALLKLQRQLDRDRRPVLILFEGWDAAGKGGAIKRLTSQLDPRSFAVYPFSAPNTEEQQQHYLWRFWRRLPARGTIGIFDRSWYGRVLVERIEGFASDREWQRAYGEINEFEAQLVTGDYILVKFWLHISADEQLKRFEERNNSPFKQYKLTDEDWRNREKWPLYEVAVNQMLQRTSTAIAPWTVIAGNDKRFARVQVLETVTQAIAAAL
ncbi:polyphosphate:AMP phosphotransferase [Synechococcus elongatus IITB4]|uniref:polyphosphate:AMP phosphotransferase n=1 Tax=Synechococcus elongatus TaxID=32046 RepID=UPI0030CE0FF9